MSNKIKNIWREFRLLSSIKVCQDGRKDRIPNKNMKQKTKFKQKIMLSFKDNMKDLWKAVKMAAISVALAYLSYFIYIRLGGKVV